LYKALNISKQAVHQRLNLYLRRKEEQYQLLPLVRQIREDHPRMSAKKMYMLINPQTMGRDRFEAFCFENGFKVQSRRNPQRTTNSLGVTRFENHLKGRELTGVNQIWVSDITYFRINENFYYLTFIMDLFSRSIVGYKASERLLCEQTTIPALEMAISEQNPKAELVLHSDGGGQYYSKEFIKLTKTSLIINSMAESVYENPHAERINGTIKNDYLTGYQPKNFVQLQEMLAKAVFMYNYQRPHDSLKKLTPKEFEYQSTTQSTINQVINKKKKETKKKNLTNTITNIVSS
jgi:transposase InsO family protein